jgi:hypothetical protein
MYRPKLAPEDIALTSCARTGWLAGMSLPPLPEVGALAGLRVLPDRQT